ncbi:MAG: 4-hydroxy-tetrahydrodipicolinate synthase [Gammaproteobacteria bacterium]|nr:4-hydroxy-tetrahydrodipicolinate synthase [Gammaproteobacteria bacterium]MDH5629028.1 4-hydroxy-tetrahydrodipicolinate synthase [Gammaproteobacteria bacterium]
MFRGSLVALVTPMTQSGEIDYQALTSLIDWHIESGTHGLVVMGTTGESSLVSQDELVATVAATVEYVSGKIPVIAGCGSASTQHVLDLLGELNNVDVDGYLCVTPYYVKPSQEGLITHYQQVAEAADKPVLLYNVPGRTACDLSNESVVVLSQHPNIVGIKDATGDIDRVKELKKSLPEDFVLLSGDDATALDFMKAGGHGVISVTANIAPKAMSLWCEMMLKKADKRQAEEIFEQLMPLHEKLFIEGNPIPIKWAMHYISKIEDGIRLPLSQPSESSKGILIEMLKLTESVRNLE